MKPKRARFALLIFVVLFAGCARTTAERRQKYFDSAMRYFQKGNYSAATIQLQNALQVDSKFTEAHFELAQCYLRQGFGNDAYRELMKTVALDAHHEEALADLSRLLFAMRKYDEAEDRANAALTIDPTDFGAEMVLANSETAGGNTAQGLADGQKAVDMAPNKPEGYMNLALLQLKAKQIPDAEKSFQKATSVAPNFLPARLALGEFYQGLHQWSDAQTQFQQAIEAHPNDTRPRAALVALYLAQGKKDEAEQYLISAKAALAQMPQGYRMLGDFYLGTGDSQKALAEFATVYKDHPDDLGVARTYIQLLILANQLDQAKELNAKLLKQNSRDGDALLLQGEILTRQGHPSDAIPELQAALASLSNNPVVHYELGQAYIRTDAPQDAENEWSQALAISPKYIEAGRALAEVALQQRHWEVLSDAADKLVQAEPNAGEAYFYRASAQIAQKDLGDVEPNLKKAIELAPHDARNYIAYGTLRILQGMPDDAERLFREALDSNPNASIALRAIVGLELQHNRLPNAIAAVQAQIAKSPNNSDFNLLLGQLYAVEKDPGKAMASAKQALALNGKDVDAELFLSRLQAGAGSIDQAIAGNEAAIQQNPGDVRLYFNEGVLQESRGNWQAAEKLYQKTLQVQPDYALAANNLAYLLIEHDGDKQSALTLAQTARKGLPDIPNTADTLAWAYYNLGAYDSAIDLLENAIKKSPDNVTYRYHLGLAYGKNNDPKHAKDELERALKLKPSESQTSEIRKALDEYSGG